MTERSDYDDARDLSEAMALADAFEAGELVIDDSAPVPELPPVTEPVEEQLVVTTIRLTLSQREAIQAICEARGVDRSALIRGWINEGLAETDADRKISLADLRRAIAGLPPAA
ncbi:ribbon-helix-helix protein, CopG family [Nocardia sp. CDC160]|uniref:ribbon-helix-helix protein, CopG family n=1 Tax=Nocardia sp. CDC160 TaxID=3112166 RepID=UPI002DBC0340|nr:ribbon-helix-helix protein, CopG family [Nocardia sp. CDC160]MEC3918234.1 ribbon-helix-helix protein, CopG family [Nocardia sp. CDC160]